MIIFAKLGLMTRILDGLELADYIKERQLKQVRALRQSWKVIPKLVIIQMGDHDVINKYAKLKSAYGKDILVDVDIVNVNGGDYKTILNDLNKDENVHGIIIQLPLSDKSLTDEVLSAVNPEKDVDGLGANPLFTPATAMAIDWLLNGYNVELSGKKIAIIGKGRLVGAPLASLWIRAGYDVIICDSKTTDLAAALKSIDVIVSATGKPGLIKSNMIAQNAVVVDAGTASENGKIVGDISDDVRLRDDLTITPEKGGVGPLTVAALFDNVITVARKIADEKGQQNI